MRGGRRDLGRLADADLVAGLRLTRLYQQDAFEAEVVIGDRAVAMPGNRLARIERIFAHQHIAALRDDVDIAHLVGLRLARHNTSLIRARTDEPWILSSPSATGNVNRRGPALPGLT